MRKRSGALVFAVLALLTVFDLFVWYEIFFRRPAREPELHFLDVGQGDSELMVLPGGVQILTDAGPDRKVVSSLERVLSPGDRYIDLAVISHPQLDHFNGFNELLKRYDFGAFIVNGRSVELPEWRALVGEIEKRKIPLIAMGAGDRIRHGESEVEILSPDLNWAGSGELNDTGLVELVKTPSWSALFTVDIGFNIEDYLLEKFDLRAEILKVGHHGSKYSSGEKFLEAVSPKLAVVGVGEGNRYGHPTPEALQRLQGSGAMVFRTDMDGTVSVLTENNVLKVYRRK